MPVIEKKFIRVPPDDPNRCQAVHADRQCPFRAVGTYNPASQKWDGPQYCMRHGANKLLEASDKQAVRMYQSAKWQAQIDHMADHPRIKSLAEEVGIIRMTLQAKLNAMTDEKDLLMNASGIVSLTNSVQALIKTWQHVEERSGQVLDRAKMTAFSAYLMEILTRYIDDADVLQMIGEDIGESLESLLRPSVA